MVMWPNFQLTNTFHEFERLRPDRNLKNVYKQYMRLTKAELATRLIEAEQYIAEGNQEYLKSYLRHMKDKSGIKIISCRDKRSGFPTSFILL